MALLTGCAPATEAEGEPLTFEQFLEGKADTGYVGSAVEIYGVVRGKLFVAAIPADDALAWEIRKQLLFAMQAFQSMGLGANFSAVTPRILARLPAPGGWEILYELNLEATISRFELKESGLDPRNLVGRSFSARVPLSLKNLLERLRDGCVSDPDTGEAVPWHEITADNAFYYFDVDRPGCAMRDEDLTSITLQVTTASTQTPEVWPEYDLLGADSTLDVVAMFGQVNEGHLYDDDPGFASMHKRIDELRATGFAITEAYPERRGFTLERILPNGLRAVVHLFSPVNFAENVPQAIANGFFRQQLGAHEIVYYDGHAMYGSLDVLDSRDAYPKDRYQIIFMDACWSYLYYTKQVFEAKATATNPTGWDLADVVNNTEMSRPNNGAGATFLRMILEGADLAYGGQSARHHSWNNMTRFMNVVSNEGYGVSGVWTNRYRPR